MHETHQGIRQRVYHVMEEAASHPDRSRAGWVHLGIEVLIILNVLVVMIETVEPIRARYAAPLLTFEIVSVAIFTIEYLLRLWSCTADPQYAHPVRGRLRFALRPMMVIDLIAILPAYLPLLGIDLRFARVLRLMRLMRVLKLARYSESIGLLSNVLRSRAGELGVMLVVLLMLLVLSSGLMYHAENRAQPDAFSSMPAALWWSVITLTTIGYGDIYPVTPVGKLIGGVIAVAGIGIVALPTAIIANGFAEELHHRRRRAAVVMPELCPHCGKPIHDATVPET